MKLYRQSRCQHDRPKTAADCITREAGERGHDKVIAPLIFQKGENVGSGVFL